MIAYSILQPIYKLAYFNKYIEHLNSNNIRKYIHMYGLSRICLLLQFVMWRNSIEDNMVRIMPHKQFSNVLEYRMTRHVETYNKVDTLRTASTIYYGIGEI